MAYTKMFSEEVWTKVNEDSKALLDDYVLELEANGKATKTIEQYVYDIKAFYCYIAEHGNNKYILDLKKRDFRNFFLGMSKNGTSSARINRLQSSIRNELQFCENDDDLYEDYETNQMRKLKGLPKESVRDIVFLSDDQVTGLIDYLIEHEQYQKALYVSLSYDSAGRRNEVYQVLKDGFETSNQTNEVIGKRSKKFKLIYFNRTREIAKLWLEQRGEDNIDSLWVIGKGESKRPATYTTLYGWTLSFRTILKKLYDEDIELNPHSFRHSALENYGQGTHNTLKELGKKELPLNVLKVIAHHTSIETTQGYLANHDDELLEDAFGTEF